MSDRAFEPAAENPFDQDDPADVGISAPKRAAPQAAAAPIGNPFDDDDDADKITYKTEAAPTTSATGAFLHGVERSIIPTIGSLPAMGAGAGVGMALGGPIGAFVGGLAGGIGGGLILGQAQDYALSKLPDSWQEAIGQDKRQQELEAKEHGTAAFIGGLVPFALTMRPGVTPKVELPPNATALQQLRAHPATSRLFQGGVMGGMEVGNELVHGESPDWTHVAIATGAGMVFNRPTRMGERLTNWGERRVTGEAGLARPGDAATETPPAQEAAPAATPEPIRPPAEKPPGITEKEWTETLLGQKPPPTLAEVGDMKVLGPGVTESVFMGTQEQAHSALVTAQQAVRTERATLGPAPVPDIQSVARQMHPELFEHYESLQAQREEFSKWNAETGEGGLGGVAKSHLDAVDAEIKATAPQIASAYRRAAEAIGPPIVPEASPPAAPVVSRETRPIEEQRAFIIGDVTRKVTAAGRPLEEAQAGAAVEAAYWETRAARFNGAKGSAEEMYRREAPEILGEGMKSRYAARRVDPPKQRQSLSQFITASGGIKATDPLIGDVKSLTGGGSKFIGENGRSLDAMREAAAEAGYIPDKSTIRTLLDAMRDEDKGRKIYKAGEEGAPEFRADENRNAIERELDAGLKEVGIDPATVSDEVRTRTMEIMEKEHITDPVQAYEIAESEGGMFQQNGLPKGLSVETSPARGDGPGHLADPRAHEIRIVNEKGEVQYRAEITQEKDGLWGVGYVENVSREHSGLASDLYQAAAKYVDERGGTLVAGMNTNRFSRAVHERLMSEGIAEPIKVGERELLKIRPGAELEQASGVKRGRIRLREDGRNTITLLKDANASTFIHEKGHDYLARMIRDAKDDLAPAQLKADADAVYKWLGVSGDEGVKTKHHEKFARGFENYIMEGRAPSAALARVFEQFRQWLVQIYKEAFNLNAPINNDIRGVFDRMLAFEPERAVVAKDHVGGPMLADIHEADAIHATPEEAHAVADRIGAERERQILEPPPDIAHEIAPLIEESRPAEPGTNAGGTVGEGPTGRGDIHADRGEARAEPEGGGVGAERREVGGGRSETAADSERPGSRADDGDPINPKPATIFGPEESPYVDKAGNIRLENLTDVESVRQALRDAADRNNDFMADRRGVVTEGQMMDLARALGMQGAEKLVRERVIGQAYNAEQVMALRLLLEQSGGDVSKASQAAARKGHTPEDVLEFAKVVARHDMIQATVSQATAEWGRAGHAFRSLSKLNKELTAQRAIQEATGKTFFQKEMEAKLMSQMDSTASISKFVQDAKKRTFGRMLLEYWINGLLSGPATQSTNAIGNTILLIQHSAVETPAAALLGSIRSAMGREGERVLWGELGARAKGLAEGLPAAIKATGQSFKAGTNMLLPGEEARALPYQVSSDLAPNPKYEGSTTAKGLMADAFGAVQGLRDGIIATGALVKAGGVEGAPLIGAQYSLTGAIPDIAVKGVNVLPIGTIARLPGRFLSAADAFFKSVNYSMAKNARAYRMAMEEGKTGNELAARIADIRDNPPEAMMAEINKEASHLTLMDQGGKFLNALSHLANVEVGGFQPVKFVSPFVHVAGNIMKQTVIERSVFGLMSAEIRADLLGKNGNVAQDMAMARMLIGTGLAVTVGTLTGEGYFSGSGPVDSKDSAMWRLAGNQAHSVRIGDMWYGIQKLGPTGMLISTAADMYKVAQLAGDGEMTEAAGYLIHAFSQNILDQSMMKGPADLLRAITDHERYGDKYVQNFLAGFIPASVAMTQFAQAGDPYSRHARSVVDAIRKKVPGHLDSWFDSPLIPRRDIWGEPMLSPEKLGGSFVTGIYTTRVSQDPVNIELLKLNISPSPVQRKIRGVDLTDEEFDDYARLAGRMAKSRLDVFVASPKWQTFPNHIRETLIKGQITAAREAARNAVMAKYRRIPLQAYEDKKAAFED